MTDEAHGPTLQVVLDAVLVRNELIDQLTETLTSNTTELQRVQTLLDTRPTKEFITYQRRKSFVTVIFIIMFVVFAQDQHVEKCSPGVEAKIAIQYIIDHPNDFNNNKLQILVEEVTPKYCSVLFPGHNHDDSRGWPNARTWLGVGLYSTLFTGFFLWVRRSRKAMLTEKRSESLSQPHNRRSGDNRPLNLS